MGNREGSIAQFEIVLPKKSWMGEVSRQYPKVSFWIDQFRPIQLDPFVVETLFRIEGDITPQMISLLETHPSLLQFSVLEQLPNRLTIISQTKDQVILFEAVKNTIFLKNPVSIQDGKILIEGMGTHPNIVTMYENLKNIGLEIAWHQIRNYSTDLCNQLTSRQKEVYSLAKKRGYYAVPREITLSDLAKELNLSKSTLSSHLQKIHHILLGFH